MNRIFSFTSSQSVSQKSLFAITPIVRPSLFPPRVRAVRALFVRLLSLRLLRLWLLWLWFRVSRTTPPAPHAASPPRAAAGGNLMKPPDDFRPSLRCAVTATASCRPTPPPPLPSLHCRHHPFRWHKSALNQKKKKENKKIYMKRISYRKLRNASLLA